MIAYFTTSDVSDISRSVYQQTPFSPKDLDLQFESHVVARRDRRRIFSSWFHGAGLHEAIAEVREHCSEATELEIAIGTTRHPLSVADWPAIMRNRNRGRLGVEFALGSRRYVVYPSNTIATNRSLRTEFSRFLTALSVSEAEFRRRGGTMFHLQFRTFIVELKDGFQCTELFRGNTVLAPRVFSSEDLDRILKGMCRWFLENQDAHGAIIYKYWPSRGKSSEKDNPIRQFMTTIALSQLATYFSDPELQLAASRHLHHNLGKFYREENGLGLIEWDGSVKLGAVALAGLAILTQPNQDAILQRLTRTVETLENPDGSFRTFLKPPDRNDNQNFYPGETLLFLTSLFLRTRCDRLLARIRASVCWYQDFFRRAKNPAFVPWHTQACYLLRESTGSHDFDQYIFEMNDWLLGMQQWGPPLDPDLWGRFYNPYRPDYGPPHASSTGVYLESLSDALALSLQTSDKERIAAYNTSIQRGIRSIAQLQYKSVPELFYITQLRRVSGALRTECYNNEIRVDNVQHTATALLKYSALIKRFPFLAEPQQ